MDLVSISEMFIPFEKLVYYLDIWSYCRVKVLKKAQEIRNYIEMNSNALQLKAFQEEHLWYSI